MDSNDAHGVLLFFRKNGQAGTSYPLCSGKTTIGSSKNADIRLKLKDERLELIHCIIDVNDSGIATLLNKSHEAPVKVNTIYVKKVKVLNHKDKIELSGKQFQYLNENLSREDVERHQKILNKAVLTLKRRSVAPLIKSAKKSPSLRTKTPIQRRASIRNSFAGSSTEFAVTPAKNPVRRSVIEKSKTTSKVVVSKALGSPRSKRKRRLSLGNNLAEISASPKISSKNILLSENIVSSTITEEEEHAPPKPSISMKDHKESREVGGFLDESNVTVENCSPKKKMSLRTPSKSSKKIIVTEAPSKVETPTNKIIESLKTPISLNKASSLSCPRASRLTKKIHRSQSIDFSNIGTLKEKFPDNRSSVKRNDEETVASVIETVTKGVAKPRLSRRSKLIDTNEENLLNQYSPKNIPSRTTLGKRRKRTNTDSEDLSSGESVMLNLSSGSSVSPINSLFSSGDRYSSNGNSSPRRSILKKSLRKSQLDQLKLSLNRAEEVHSSSEGLNLEWNTNDSFQSKSATKSRPSLRRNKEVEKEVEEIQSSSEESSESLNEEPNRLSSLSGTELNKDISVQKSATKSRSSSRRSRATEERFVVQSSSEESAESPVRGSNTNNSTQRSTTKSRQSSKRSRMTEEQFETQSSSEESLQVDTKTYNSVEAHGRESSSSAKVRQSLRKNSTKTALSLVQTPNMSIATYSRAEESFLVTESGSPNMNIMRSRSNIMEDTEMQVSSDSGSPNESNNGSPRKSTGRTSRQSLRKDNIVNREDSTPTSDSDSPSKSSKSIRSNSLRAETRMMSSSEDSLHLRLSESPQLLRNNISSGRQSQRRSRREDSSCSTENEEKFEQPRRSSMRKTEESSIGTAEMLNEQGSPMKKSSGKGRARESEVSELNGSVPAASITTRRTSLRQSMKKSGKINEDRSLNEKYLLSENDGRDKQEEDDMLSSDDENLENKCVPIASITTRRTSLRQSTRKSDKIKQETSLNEKSVLSEYDELEKQEDDILTSDDEHSENKSVPAASVTTRRTSLRQSMRKSAKINEERSLNEKSLLLENVQPEKQDDEVFSDYEHLENHTPTVETPKELNSSMRKSARISKRRESEANQSSISNITGTQTPSQRQSSVRKSANINENQSLFEEPLLSEANEPSSSEDESPEYSFLTSGTPKEQNLSTRKTTRTSRAKDTPRTPSQRRSSVRKSVGSTEDASSLSENEEVHMLLSSRDESPYSSGTSGDRNTPKLRHSSVRKSHLSQAESEASEAETSLGKSSTSRRSSMNKSTPINKSRKASLGASTQNISVITVNDSVDSTPENNTSIIILDTPFEKTRRPTHKKLSKTMNSTIQDDVELTTPKSVIKSRRSKSLPYIPITEDITPVSPISNSKGESGFKTPLNTPGLFENIRKSVLKSRSRSQRSSNNLLEELSKEEPSVKAVKRPRESSGSSIKSSKRRKVTEGQSDASFGTDTEDLIASFGSFRTEDVLSDISDQNVDQKTPEHFKNLTDKPVINVPHTRSTTEPRKVRPKSLRRSLHTMRLGTQSSSLVGSSQESDEVISPTSLSSELSDDIFENSTNSNVTSERSSRRSSLAQSIEEQDLPKKVQKSPKNDLSDVAGLKKLLRTPKERKSPKNDLTDVRGVKKLLQTPKSMKSPKNDLMNVPNLKKLMSPKAINSPKNDLTNIVGVKKLFSTPKETKSPKNDLRKVPNLRRLMSPKQQNSPKNDLSDVAGLKKLLSSPKVVKSPENDLRNVPNLRRLMSPVAQNSPRNDLSNVAGVKKLLSTPKAQNSPRNDLTDIPNLRRIMSPKQQNSPKNDLSDVRGLKRLLKTPRKVREPVNDLTNVEGIASVFNISGVQRLSNESDIENNEDLFDKLFAKRPLRTYRGKSLSPTTRKATLFGDHRKTLGDNPLTSPRVERWVEEQAIIKAGNNDEVFEEVGSGKGRRREDKQADRVPKKVKGQKNDVGQEALIENNFGDHKITEESNIEPPRGGRRKRVGTKDHEEKGEVQEQDVYMEEEVAVKMTSKGRKLAEESNVDSPKGGRKRRVANDETKVEEKVPRRGLRGQRRVEEIVNDENKPDSPRTPRGRRKVVQIEEEPKQTSTPLSEVILIEESISTEAESKKKPTRSRRRAALIVDREETEVDSTSTVNLEPPSVKRIRSKKTAKKEDTEDQIAEVHSTTEEIRSSPAPTDTGEEEKDDDASSDTEIVVMAPRRGRARIIIRERNYSTEDLEVKPRRGRMEAREKEVPSAKTRGKKKIPVDNCGELEVVPDVVEVSTKRGKGRNVASVEEKNTEKRGRAGKLASIDDGADESDNSVVSTRKTRLRKEDAIDTMPSKKPTRSRKAAANVEAEELSNLKEIETEVSEELPKVEKTVKNTRGRRAPKQSQEEVESPEVVKKGRSKKKVEEIEGHQENNDVKPAKTTRSTRRGVKNVGVEQEDEEETRSPAVPKKPTRSRKKASEEDIKGEVKETEPTKSTRSRRQKTQEQSQEADISEEKEDIVTKPTNKRTRGKAFEEETMDVDSPRTARARRGNFKKYGSDFVTETNSPRREGKLKKAVHFEEMPANDEGGDSQKRRGRNAAKVQDNEETARRSKRTRK